MDTIHNAMNKKIAFLFPGQGSQTVGMGRDLAERFSVAKETFAEADEACGFALSKLCFHGPEEDLKLTENTQPAIMTVSVAVLRVLAEHGLQPALAAGHSLGEWSAHVAAGTLNFADAARAVKARGRAMQSAVPAGQGAMAAILSLDPEQVAEACEQTAAETGLIVAAANLNSPGQTVISGAAAAVEKAAALCKAKGARRAVMLPVSAPFHCALMQPAADIMEEALSETALQAPVVPLVANVTAAATIDPQEIKELLVEQATRMVRWRESVLLFVADEIEEVVEAGAGRVLAGLVKRVDRSLAARSVGTPAEIDALVQLL